MWVSSSHARKSTLIVRGGWDGHQPVEATEMFMPFLAENGFSIRVEESPAVYREQDFMDSVDLIVQSNTMTTIEKEEFLGLRSAIENGAGFAGWHGGIIDSYRDTSDYLHMMGAQFATHAGIAPELRIGEQSDNYLPFMVNFLPEAASHVITEGICDFEITTEQYWVLSDPYIDVLATTTQKVRSWDPWTRELTFPVIYTRNWGKGKIFVSTLGHRVEILAHPSVNTMIKRGLLWASR